MKNSKFRIAVILLAALLCLAACGPNAPDDGLDVSATEVPATDAPETAAAPASDDAAARQAFAAALTDLAERHVLPDGTPCEADPAQDMIGNRFAVYDVDMDGEEELILAYQTAPMAGQTQYVFGYDAGSQQLRTEFSAFPLLTFYDNGVIKADWSHNQGLAGAFWPYSLYRYDPAADSYDLVAMIDAWDKNFAAADPQGNPFPDDADVSGMGLVYYIMPGGEYDNSTPVDASEYDGWYAAQLDGATELEIP